MVVVGGTVGGECGGNYSRADSDPCVEPQREESELAITII